jgi:hypothetical protein
LGRFILERFIVKRKVAACGARLSRVGLRPRSVDVNQYTEGTLIVDMVEAASKQLVWRGTATGTIQLNDVDTAHRGTVEKAAGGG